MLCLTVLLQLAKNLLGQKYINLFNNTQVKNDTKQTSMYNQFLCHADFARGFKTPWNLEPWNLEPWKQDKGCWGFVRGGCN